MRIRVPGRQAGGGPHRMPNRESTNLYDNLAERTDFNAAPGEAAGRPDWQGKRREDRRIWVTAVYSYFQSVWAFFRPFATPGGPFGVL